MKLFNKKEKLCNFDSYFNNCDSIINDSVGNIFVYKNILSDGFVVQGFTIVDNYLLISAYSSLKKCKREKSRIYFYNKENGEFLGYVILDNAAHVGGITYDHLNGILFVTGTSGKINVYNYKKIISLFEKNNFYLDLNTINLDSIKIKCRDLDISLYLEGNVSAATIYYYDNYLYVATCSYKGSLVKFRLNYDDDYRSLFVLCEVVSINLPACVQGIVVFSYKNNNYLVVSQSYGKTKSCLKLYKLLDDIRFLGQENIRCCGIEGIDIDSCGNIHCIFENGNYFSYVTHISKLCKSFNKRWEKNYILMGKIHQNRLDKKKFIV